MPIQWYGEERHREIMGEMERRVQAASVVVMNAARGLVGVAGTMLRGKPGRDKSGKFTKAKIYGAVRSQPGEPPRKQTGQLRRSIAREVVALVGRVGTNLEYGRHLELGTRHMAARPWLRRALNESRQKLVSILGKPIR